MRTRQGWTGGKVVSAALLSGLALAGLLPEHARGASYEENVMLHGAPVKSEKVSGYRGTPFTLAVDDDAQAMYGISSEERRNHPCALWVGTESINDPARDSGAVKNLCGGTPTSRSMRAEYRDDMYFGRRVFVTGIRVCTNNKETRVKGFQLRGKQIQNDGRLAALTYPDLKGGTIRLTSGEWDLSQRDEHKNDSKNPADYRNNCKEWHAWADCPYPSQVATGLIAHFEAGKTPRSLTGVQLECRYVSQIYVPASAR